MQNTAWPVAPLTSCSFNTSAMGLTGTSANVLQGRMRTATRHPYSAGWASARPADVSPCNAWPSHQTLQPLRLRKATLLTWALMSCRGECGRRHAAEAAHGELAWRPADCHQRNPRQRLGWSFPGAGSPARSAAGASSCALMPAVTLSAPSDAVDVTGGHHRIWCGRTVHLSIEAERPREGGHGDLQE